MTEKFLEMLNLQNTLNVNTNGKDWTKGTTLQNRPINWYRCIYMEAAEAIDSLNWKHWKDIDKKDDMDNLKIEVVDKWHFISSQAIVDKGSVEEAMKYCYDMYNQVRTTAYTEKISIIDALESIIDIASSKKLPLEMFFRTVDAIEDFSMDNVYSLYIGKNCLNQFRQDNGYKDGTYIKVWKKKEEENGEEDNVYMQRMLVDNPNITYDELYSSLTATYRELT